MNSLVNALLKFDLFKNEDRTTVEEIARKMLVRSFKRKSVIVMEGEPADYFYFVLEGKVKLSKLSEDGQEKIVLIIGCEEFFGEVSALDGGEQPLIAETLVSCKVAMLPIQCLREILEDTPRMALIIMDAMAKRMRQSYRQIKNLAMKNTQSRLASRLFKLSRDYGKKDGDVINIELQLTHQELASLVGTSRETVSRTLSGLEKENIISITNQRISILDMPSLKKLF
ncbi:CRP/FNR family transcriptional regulator [Desulfitispora alkaliphila]|uniref:Crp/Fnr family transcriptional regulator n=1 Tax=Desulfitispora alkaliphila TaxID=622674 RepID=UPI003D19EC1D